MDDLDDEEIDRIVEHAQEAAQSAYWPGGIPANPYPEGTERNDVWASAFSNAFVREGWH